jgi:hypothetical protein
MSDDDLIRRGDALAACSLHNSARAAEQTIAALPAVAPAVRVKPLVWVRMVSGALKADTPLARYIVSGGCWSLWTHTHGETKHSANEQDAQAAAQADYEARILAALEPSTPSPDPAALVKAALEAAAEQVHRAGRTEANMNATWRQGVFHAACWLFALAADPEAVERIIENGKGARNDRQH